MSLTIKILRLQVVIFAANCAVFLRRICYKDKIQIIFIFFAIDTYTAFFVSGLSVSNLCGDFTR